MAGSISLICPVCKNQHEKYIGHYNRAMKLGAPVYCSRKCAGLGRRSNKTVEQKKAEKSAYDKARLNGEHREKILAEKKKYYFDNHEEISKKLKVYRDKNMQRHVEYCRQPEYREKKKAYDHKHRLQQRYGEFWEAASVLVKLDNELDSKQIKLDNGIVNKSQKRKRQWKTLMQNP